LVLSQWRKLVRARDKQRRAASSRHQAQWLRNFFRFCRNPIGNFMGFVIGVEGYDYSVTGPKDDVMLTTLYDAVPPRYGFKWSVISLGWFRLPFVSHSGRTFLWYLGWRPASGGFGFKFNIRL
jgi:hypothetical protein